MKYKEPKDWNKRIKIDNIVEVIVGSLIGLGLIGYFIVLGIMDNLWIYAVSYLILTISALIYLGYRRTFWSYVTESLNYYPKDLVVREKSYSEIYKDEKK